jgi:hypothetical protein
MNVNRVIISLFGAALLLLSACSGNTQRVGKDTDRKNDLSGEYDYVLCEGTDSSGANYKLVVKQEESATGSSLSMGVIKDAAWETPLSASFPFITAVQNEGASFGNMSQDGSRNTIIRDMWFIDSGAFLFQYGTRSTTTDVHYAVMIYNCSSKTTITINEFDDIVRGNKFYGTYTKNNCIEASFSNGKADSFGEIVSYDGVLTMVEIHKNGIYLDDCTFDSYLLNLSDFSKTYIAKNTTYRAAGPYSEGMILFSDQKFYTKDGAVAIDLNSLGYNIDSLGQCRFENGQYSFVAVNDIGSKYRVTIDKSGSILSEQKE